MNFIFVCRNHANLEKLENLRTWGESLNMGAQTISGVEWCLAARARVCVPLTALSPPFARTVCVPMMTWGEGFTMQIDPHDLIWLFEKQKKNICMVRYLINTRHDRKYGSICDHSCFNAGFWETGCHLMSLEKSKEGISITFYLHITKYSCFSARIHSYNF